MTSIDRQIAQELGVREEQVAAAVALLDGGATVPFIARYRKEATGALDDAQLRTLEERLRYLRELEERRAVILNSIREQGKLDDALEAAIRPPTARGGWKTSISRTSRSAAPRPRSPRKPDWSRSPTCCSAHPEKDPQIAAARFVDAEKQVADAAAALEGARAILVERFAEDADLDRCRCASRCGRVGRLTSQGARGQDRKPAPNSATISISPRTLTKLPSHRILALFRGEKEEILDLAIEPENPATAADRIEPLRIARSCAASASPTAGVRPTTG